MIRVPVPLDPYDEVTVTLSGVRYKISYFFNERDNNNGVEGRWYCNIKDSNDNTLVNGLKLLEYAPMDIHLRYGLPDGFLYIYKLEASEEKAGRNNVGIGKPYELTYTTYEELTAT